MLSKLTLNLKCFAFDDLGLERRPELDFHANSIRMGNDALIDLNKNDHWFQLISLTGKSYNVKPDHNLTSFDLEY